MYVLAQGKLLHWSQWDGQDEYAGCTALPLIYEESPLDH